MGHSWGQAGAHKLEQELAGFMINTKIRANNNCKLIYLFSLLEVRVQAGAL